MPRNVDVAIVGGGIAGGAAASALARAGLAVLLLERQTEYRDRVLGEGMMPWGVAEARRTGVDQVLLGNPEGAVTLTHWLTYEVGGDPVAVERSPSKLGNAIKGVDGILDVRHPIACEALAADAERAGATVIRGVSDVTATLGRRPTVSWRIGGAGETAVCRLIVGADGKVSTIRKLASIELREDAPTSVTAGMLTGGLDGAPSTMGYSLHESDRHLISFPQAGDRARLYVCVAIADRNRFAGAGGVGRFLAAWDSPSLPFGSAVAGGRQDGPCGTFPLNSAFVDAPVAEGLVLIGDAAGWVDPLIGQGLSMAMRDVRSLTDVVLDGPAWTADAFAGYAAERRERLKILALNARVQQRLDVDFTPEFASRRLEVTDQVSEDDVFGPLLGTQTRGPEAADRRVLETAERKRLGQLLGWWA